MAYLRINQIKELYDISDKTIRRLYEKNKSNPNPPISSRSQGYKNKKGKWVISEDFLESRFADKRIEPDQAETKSDPRQTKTATNSDQSLVIESLREQIQLLKDQVADYKQSNQNLNQSLVSLVAVQQSLTNRLDRLEIQAPNPSPTEPITADITPQTPKAQPIKKKPVRQAKKGSQAKQKAPKPKKKWWQRG